jgi:hypothetical protein
LVGFSKDFSCQIKRRYFLGLTSLFIAMIYSETVNAFSLDSLFLSLRINSQSLVVAKPSVAIVIFVSNNSLSFLDDACAGSGGDNISAIDFFERLAITSVFIYEANNTLYDIILQWRDVLFESIYGSGKVE